jgi:hypothetical protein
MALNLDSNIIFVGGYFRSGTSMMQGLLSKAPETGDAMRECSYLRGLMEAYVMARQRFDVNTYDFFGTGDAGKQRFHQFHASILNDFWGAAEEQQGDARLVVKEPMTTACFPELAQFMPNAQFVVMVRDIRDVIGSQAARAARSGEPYQRRHVNNDLEEYAKMYRRLKNSEQTLRDRLLYVSYEELVQNPEQQLQRVTGFLGISAVAADWWPSKRMAGEYSASAYERQRVSAEPLGRHRQVLHPQLIYELEQRGRELTDRLGINCVSAAAGPVTYGTQGQHMPPSARAADKPARLDEQQ